MAKKKAQKISKKERVLKNAGKHGKPKVSAKKVSKELKTLAAERALKREAIEDLERVERMRKKFRCLPFSMGCFLALIMALVVPLAVYGLAAITLAGNTVWYVTGGVFFGILFLLFLVGILLRKAASSLSLGLLFGLAFSLIIILIAAAALLLTLVWVSKSTQLKA